MLSKHGSHVSVAFITEKYWKLLNMTGMAPYLQKIANEIPSPRRALSCQFSSDLRPSWLGMCTLNIHFTNGNIRKNAVLSHTRKITGESKLTANMGKKYHPRNRLPTDVHEFKEAFGLKAYSFRDLEALLLRMEAYDFAGAQTKATTLIKTLTVAVTINELYQKPATKGSVKRVAPPESLPLLRLLPAEVVDDMYVKAVGGGPAWSMRSASPGLSLSLVEEYLISSKRDYFFSLQLYRDGISRVTWKVDAILAVP
ncbi:unnamed protein product [Peronospora destructor]|uniref:Uncharacterized protein n=1 Tax=Peronospora destructor TaxID=86335 RepID=A0AAV0UPJ7_9STRA|nr:unnamed protein product [Peronospora destructor]